MFNRFIFILLLFFGIISCENIFKRTGSLEEKKIITQPIDFSSVDMYPLLPECKQIISRELQKECFYRLLSKQIEVSLSKQDISFSKHIKDTILVNIKVNSYGKLSVSFFNNADNSQFDYLKKTIIKTIDNLPIIQPAIKQGIPVTSEYVLPIVIKLKTNS